MKITLAVGEVGDLITALDHVIEYEQSIMRSEFPRHRKNHNVADFEMMEESKENIKVFRKLRRKLAKLEER